MDRSRQQAEMSVQVRLWQCGKGPAVGRGGRCVHRLGLSSTALVLVWKSTEAHNSILEPSFQSLLEGVVYPGFDFLFSNLMLELRISGI